MATVVYLVKRCLRKQKRNGQREYRWALRWEDGGGFRCESTGTADKTQAEALQKLKWAEVDGLTPPRETLTEPIAMPGPSWKECRDALERAMQADNLRPSYVSDAVLVLEMLRRVFPAIVSPADITPEMANEYKRRRVEGETKIDAVAERANKPGKSPWTIKGDLSTLKAVFGKWLVRECGLLSANPFANVRPPKCDDPDVRIVSAAESAALAKWLGERWNEWQLPLVFLDVAALLGWRVTEIASIREDDLLADGFVRVAAETCKTRRHKFGWLPAELYADVKACAAGGYAFGRFSDDLRRLLLLWKRRPHHAAKVGDFAPDRLVGWLQDELKRFNVDQAAKAAKDGREWEPFTLHDFRRTAFTGVQMAGVTEKEASVMVGATPEVIRKHYEKLDQQAIARRSVQLRLTGRPSAESPVLARPLRAAAFALLDGANQLTQTQVG